MTNSKILDAYRHLYRAALRAVNHSPPAKYQIRDSMRSAFRTEPATSFDQRRVDNTMDFLRRAREFSGMEHKILRNLLHARYWQNCGKLEPKV